MAPDVPLKLRAEDPEDLAVISAVLQDALVAVADFTYDRAARRFTLVANRFRWEAKPDGADGETGFERTLCALSFGEVEHVAYRGFRRRDDDRILSLLAIRLGEAGGIVHLDFSGGAGLRLKAGALRVHASDVGEPWPTAWRPDHEVDDRR
ncbi:MAG TPA: DUF2948 family protein [Stellaceae bacterium]|nr:DUF2948 family protein [Stellaceae bacterium]